MREAPTPPSSMRRMTPTADSCVHCRGRTTCWTSWCLERACRTLSLMHQLAPLARAAQFGFEVKGGGTRLVVAGEAVRVCLKEEVQAQNNLPIMPGRWSGEEPRRQKAVGTGRLMLLVFEPLNVGLRTTWKDGKIPLEERLSECFASLRDLPERLTRKRMLDEEKARVAREREQKRCRRAEEERAARRREDEALACRAALVEQASRWARLAEVRASCGRRNS